MGGSHVSPSGTTTPPPVVETLRRQRLHARLTAACAEVPLVTLVAGAGFGKTTALASWVTEVARDADVTWIAAGAAAASPRGLIEVVRGALGLDERERPPSDMASRRGGRPRWTERDGDPEGRRRIVVLDDLQDAGARRTVSALGHPIELTPPGVTLVLASRREVLGLGTPRAEGRLVEVGADELSMDADEIRAVFDAGGITLEDGQLDRLVELTDGWPVAVRLACSAAASGCGRPDARALEERLGRAVGRYLADEVFTHLPATSRDVLACTSILDPIHADLAIALSGDDLAPAILDAVVSSTGLFTPVEDAPGWVRPHRLAQAYLLTTLRAGGSQRVRDLHDRAAGWFTGRGEIASALGHAIRSRNETTIRDAVDRIGLAPLLCADERSIRLACEIASTPPEVWPSGRPLVLAVAVLASSNPPAAVALLSTVDHTAMRDDADRRLWAVARCKVLRNQGRQVDARAALAAASWQGAHQTEIALRDSEFALTGVSGESVEQLSRRAEHALMLTRSVGADRPTLQLRVALSVLALLRGEPRDAREHARAALELGRHFGPELELELAEARVVCVAASIDLGETQVRDPCCEITRVPSELGAPVHLLVAGAMTDLHRRWRAGDPPRPLLDQLGRVLGSVDLGAVYPGILLSAVLLELRLAEASQDLRRVHQAVTRLPTGPDGSAEARLLRAEQQRVHRAYRQGRAELRPIITGEVAPLCGSTRLTALVLDGVLAHHGGDRCSASLTEALEVAIATGRRGPFIDLGAVMCEALEAHRAALQSHAGYVESLIDELRQRGPVRIPEPLTRAEVRVLRLLASMATLQEIASGLHVSRNTVKTHAAAIYRKLEVRSRREAVTRARQLGLI
jgi:LuxR family transcriptional regulator, maltose regulon positive regulatory protein